MVLVGWRGCLPRTSGRLAAPGRASPPGRSGPAPGGPSGPAQTSRLGDQRACRRRRGSPYPSGSRGHKNRGASRQRTVVTARLQHREADRSRGRGAGSLRSTAGESMNLADRLRRALGPDIVFEGPENVIVYEYDYGLDRGMPDLVVLPRTTAEVQVAVREAQEAQVPIVARGAGTGISGGAVPNTGGLVIGLSRMNRILEIDVDNRCAVVQPGVINLDLSKAAEPAGLFFAPDPSSQKASTIGGNVANNAGGPHCLSLGVTVNHILGLEVVLYDGSLVRLGGKSADEPGLDLTGVLVGSEGTLGVVTEATVRLLPLPEAVRTTLALFGSVEQASEAVSGLIGRGMVPSALEMMDRLALSAIEAAFHAGYPPEAGAVLLVEVDGLLEQVEAQAEMVDAVCRAAGALEIRLAATADERARLWAARKGAASAMGRIAPNYYLHA